MTGVEVSGAWGVMLKGVDEAITGEIMGCLPRGTMRLSFLALDLQK